MGYKKIPNLYKDRDILLFKECYAMEKIHGTSAHVTYKRDEADIKFFSGGGPRETFVALFDREQLLNQFDQFRDDVTVYGEFYGGKIQKCSDIYGTDQKFVAFEVKIGDKWLSVPAAQAVVLDLGLEFVDFVKVPTDLEALNAERDKPSVQAIRNGCGDDKEREGVVLRPLIEVTRNSGSRICAKYKRDKFRETKTPRVVSEADLQQLTAAQAIAEEWVTPMRLNHVCDALGGIEPQIENADQIIPAMCDDVRVEAGDEIVWDKTVAKKIGAETVRLLKQTQVNNSLAL